MSICQSASISEFELGKTLWGAMIPFGTNPFSQACLIDIMGVHKKKCLEAIFSIIKTTYNGYFFVIKIIDKVLSLSKFW